MKTRVMSILGVVLVLSMLLASCAPKEIIKTVEVGKEVVKTVEVQKEVVKTVEVQKEVQVVVTPTPVPTTRTGAWVDSVIFTSQDSDEAAVTQMLAGELDIYAFSVANPTLFTKVKENPDLAYSQSYGSTNELTFNPATFSDGRLNPFSNKKIREAMNWLIDRNYLVQEIYNGLAAPKLFCLNSAFPDYARYVDTAKSDRSHVVL